MAITPTDLPGVDESTARLVLAVARSIAPIEDLDGEGRLDAIAILQTVAAELPPPGEGRIGSMSRNGTSVTFARSAFSDEIREALMNLCAAPSTTAQGSFPAPSGLDELFADRSRR